MEKTSLDDMTLIAYLTKMEKATVLCGQVYSMTRAEEEADARQMPRTIKADHGTINITRVEART